MTLLAADPAGPAQLDPLAPSVPGRWQSGRVRVIHAPSRRHRYCDDRSTCTPRFCARRDDGHLIVTHDLGADELCDEIAVLLADELDARGVLTGQSDFESVFTGIVRSTVAGSAAAWLRFYRNSLHRLEHGTARFAPIHAHAAELLTGSSLVDLGSCFGFFPLRAAALGIQVSATDLSAPTMDLLDRVAGPLGRPLRTVACDATDVPLPDACADTVTVLHLLEHLEPDPAQAVLNEALRLARRRVVVAVPFEDEPRACYGHVQRFDRSVLARLGDSATAIRRELRATVHEHHGGWLVLD